MQFDGCGLQVHVQGRLGGAVAVPAALVVVRDAAHAGRQLGVDARARRQQGREVPQHHQRPDGIERKRPGQNIRLQCRQRLLGAHAVNRQGAGCVQHEVVRATRRKGSSLRGQTSRVLQVKATALRAGQGFHMDAARVVLQCVHKRLANGAAGADDQRPVVGFKKCEHGYLV